jgi:hypothetical protein
MNFISIKLLDPIHIEKMWRMYKIQDGLIVQEVCSCSLLFIISKTVRDIDIMEYSYGNWTLGGIRIACRETWNLPG